MEITLSIKYTVLEQNAIIETKNCKKGKKGCDIVICVWLILKNLFFDLQLTIQTHSKYYKILGNSSKTPKSEHYCITVQCLHDSADGVLRCSRKHRKSDGKTLKQARTYSDSKRLSKSTRSIKGKPFYFPLFSLFLI